MVIALIVVLLLLLYAVLILRPGSSWWVERKLRRGGCVQAPYWHIPLYGALKGFDFTAESMFRTPGVDEAPVFSTTLGNVIVVTRSMAQSVELWGKIQDLPKEQALYEGVDFMTFGSSVLSLSGSPWAMRRKCLARSFKNMDRVEPIVRRHTEHMLDAWAAQGTRINVLKDVTRLTFNVILEFALGMRVEPALVEQLMTDMEWLLEASWGMARWPIVTAIRMRLPGEFRTRHLKCRAVFESLISLAKQTPDSACALHAFTEAGLSDSEILSEIILLLFAGHDTTSSTIVSAVYEVCRNPQLQHADGTSLFREALRMYPPVASSTLRHLSEPISICGGKYTFPVGCVPMPFIGPLHHDPLNFASPKTFDPSRFATPNAGKLVAFSVGPRNCVGQPLAMLEGPLVIRAILDRFGDTLTLHPDSRPVFTWMQTWKWHDIFLNVA